MKFKNFYKRHEPVILGAILAIVLTSLSLLLANAASQGLELSDRLVVMQITLSSVAFFAVFIALILTMAQFRKSMAKPLIKAAFNEKREQNATLTYKDGRATNTLPSLWLINEGNAITRYFQIDFIIPEDIWRTSITKYVITPYISYVKDNENYKLSYTNEGRYTLFVNTPHQDPNMVFSAAIDASKCIEFYKDSFKVKYRIYGDWAETQKGELKVKVKKS